MVVGEKWEEENRLLRRGRARRMSDCARGEWLRQGPKGPDWVV